MRVVDVQWRAGFARREVGLGEQVAEAVSARDFKRDVADDLTLAGAEHNHRGHSPPGHGTRGLAWR